GGQGKELIQRQDMDIEGASPILAAPFLWRIRMRASATAIILAVCISLGVAVEAQNTPTTPGTRDTGKVSAGTYMVDASHTQVLFAFDHLGFSNNFGLFARLSGSLTLDPAKPE